MRAPRLTVVRRIAWAAAAAALTAVALQVACLEPWPHRYRGDGAFTDAGWGEGSERYTLRLGALDPNATEPVRASWDVGRLPRALALGVRFRLTGDEAWGDLRTRRVRVRVVERSSGDVVLAFEGPLENRGAVTLGGRRESPEVELVTAKLGAAVPGRTRVEVELVDAGGRPLRNAAEVVLVGGGWE